MNMREKQGMKTGLVSLWKESLGELRDIYALTCCGILAALAVALKFVASIDIGQYIRIGFSDLPGMAVSVLFGPAVGGIFWGILDIIKYIVAPTGPFFPGFTFSAVVNGILFGWILYHHSLTVQRVFAAQLVSKLMVSIGINTYWLSILYGNAFLVMLPARVLTAAVMLPIDTALTFVILRFTARLWRRTVQLKDGAY